MSAAAPLRVLLADRAGPARRALGALLHGLDGVTLAGEVSSREEIGAAVRRLRPDVVVIDDRLVAGEDHLLAEAAVRTIVVGVDDAPAYAARASALGAEAWLLKDRAGEELPLLLGGVSGALLHTAACPAIVVPNGVALPLDGLFGKVRSGSAA